MTEIRSLERTLLDTLSCNKACIKFAARLMLPSPYQMASNGWNAPGEKNCNWGFQEKSRLGDQALPITIEDFKLTQTQSRIMIWTCQ
jgi:hypothetical protein